MIKLKILNYPDGLNIIIRVLKREGRKSHRRRCDHKSRGQNDTKPLAK